MLLLAMLLVQTGAGEKPAEKAQPPLVATSAPRPAEKMICRTTDVIGSRVQKRKVCMPAKQWNRVGTSAREMGQAMQDRMTSGAPQ